MIIVINSPATYTSPLYLHSNSNNKQYKNIANNNKISIYIGISYTMKWLYEDD